MKKISLCLSLFVLTFAFTSNACLNLSGKYLLQSDDSSEPLTITQTNCQEATAVYEYGESGHSWSRKIIFDGLKRPYIDDDSYLYVESFIFKDGYIYVEKEYHFKRSKVSMFVVGKIYLDQSLNFVEEETFFDKDGKQTDRSRFVYSKNRF